MHRFVPRHSIALAIAIICVTGCGESGSISGLSQQTGTVTIDGDPLPFGTISFLPADGGTHTASGEIDREGKFVVHTTASSKGLPPGEYLIAVHAWDVPPGMDDKGRFAKGISAIPIRYTDAKQSGLKATILPNSNEPLEVALSSKDEKVVVGKR